MSEFSIRPHHMLCLQFFEGKGYSDGFVQNMTTIKKHLETENPMVDIAGGPDDICGGCPNCIGGMCVKEAEIIKHDERVYEQVRDYLGKHADWNTISDVIRREIIDAGKVKQVCVECRWSHICF